MKRRVYGPVPSRRLGLSLGVDLIPYKTCCFDCVYCQVGPTTRLAARRCVEADVDDIARQVESALRSTPRPELITMAGSGEPTLCHNLGALAAALRRVTDLPLALLTNGGLLWHPDVLRDALSFDLVLPSLDAATAQTFARINAPDPSIGFDQMLQGLRAFARHFEGVCHWEVMLVQGINDGPLSLKTLAALLKELAPTTVDLNTVVRPPAHRAAPLAPSALEQAATSFAGLPVRVVAEYRGGSRAAADSSRTGSGSAAKDPERTDTRPKASGRRSGDSNTAPGAFPQDTLAQRVQETIARRPCTRQDLGVVLGQPLSAVEAVCSQLLASAAIAETRREGRVFLVPAGRASGACRLPSAGPHSDQG